MTVVLATLEDKPTSQMGELPWTITEGDWSIFVQHQFELYPYKPYVAIATRINNGRIEGFNKEGWTPEEALNKAKNKCLVSS